MTQVTETRLWGVLQIVAVGLLAWLLVEVHALSVKVARIEGNRFTSMDAITFLQERVPPPEVRLLLDQHTAAIERLNKRMDVMQAQLLEELRKRRNP